MEATRIVATLFLLLNQLLQSTRFGPHSPGGRGCPILAEMRESTIAANSLLRAVNQKREKRRDRDDCGSNNHFVQVGRATSQTHPMAKLIARRTIRLKGKVSAFRRFSAVLTLRMRSGGEVLGKVLNNVVRGTTSLA